MKDRKWLIIVSVLIVLSIVIAVSVMVKSNNNKKIEKPPIRKYTDDRLDIRQKLYEEYSDVYGGSYYTEDGKYIVNLVNNANNQVIDFVQSQNIEINYVDYSIKELEIAQNKLTEKIEELEIKAVELNEKDNKVIVYLEEIDEERVNKIKDIYDTPMVEIEKMEGKITF